jgi:DNA-binding GntR family transcriptional regulator
MSSDSATRAIPLKSTIADEIRRRIVEGVYAPGQRISDKELTLELGGSRTPIREALLELKSEGLVVVRPQHGTFVFDASQEDIRNLCALRGIYEAGAVRFGVENNRAQLALSLKRCITNATTALQNGDWVACERLDREFHETLIESSGNPLLIDAYRLIADKVNVLRHRLPRTRERLARALKQHRRIAEFVEHGDAEAASMELSSHVGNVYTQLARKIAASASVAKAPSAIHR